MRRSSWLAWPPLLYLLLLLLLPLAIVISYSVRERDVDGGVLPGYSAEGWQLASNDYTRTILVRSLLLAGKVTLACLLIGYPCALALVRLSSRWREWMVLLLSFPLFTSLLLRIYGWKVLLPVEWRDTLWTAAFVLTINYLPFLLLPVMRALERLDTQLLDAARDLGATPWQVFWRVRWPLTLPGVLAGCALVFIPVAGEYVVPSLLGGPDLVLGTLIVDRFLAGRPDWPYGAAAALWLLALVLLPALLTSLQRSDAEVQR